MANKLIRGSLIIFIGNIIFRVGGYFYRFLMAILLGPVAYGNLGITLPFQGIFQTLSAGGLPPAIAKYVAEYEAVGEHDMARQTIYTALQIMIFLGLFFGVLMIFVVAPFLAYNFLHKPITLVPLQIVGLITPFSVIVGAFRGAFQGVYKMEYIVYTRAVEQLGMILFATAFDGVYRIYPCRRTARYDSFCHCICFDWTFNCRGTVGYRFGIFLIRCCGCLHLQGAHAEIHS